MNTREARALLLRDVLERRALYSVFQPIFNFKSQSVLGYEALIRGPRSSVLQSPIELFDAANDEGSLLQLSIICIQTVLQSFAALRLAGKLFLNVSPRVIAQPGFRQDRARETLERLGLKPERVIIELTEHHPTLDFAHVHDSLLLYRSMGFQVAIDDLGEGFSSLRLWSELKPEYVKADKHFVTGLADHPVKTQFMRALQLIADSCGTQIIAEGIESASDFKLVRELGIACGQGYFIGVPTEKPKAEPSAEVREVLGDKRIPIFPVAKFHGGVQVTSHQFLREVEAIEGHMPVRKVVEIFEASQKRYSIPVIENGAPVGLVARRHVRAIKRFDDQSAEALSRPCREIMNVAPMMVDRTLALNQLTTILAESTPQHLADGFIITAEGRYLGMGSVNDVLRVLNDNHLTAARYISPLTLLPGQVPANEHLQRLLGAGVVFVAALCEIDHMKGFNDTYGFAKGDELIRATGLALRDAGDTSSDFTGHIYGNRYLVLAQSADWESRLRLALEKFSSNLREQLSEEEILRGNFIWKGRRGTTEVRPLPRLVIGVVEVSEDKWESRHDVMAAVREANARAKMKAGNNIEIMGDNRHPDTPSVRSS